MLIIRPECSPTLLIIASGLRLRGTVTAMFHFHFFPPDHHPRGRTRVKLSGFGVRGFEEMRLRETMNKTGQQQIRKKESTSSLRTFDH
jgi:hypothetical protein